MFHDDIVLVDKSRGMLDAKIEVWRDFESKGFKIGRTKAKYMICNFNQKTERNDG